MEIKFGTSGWRDIIGDNFTFDNVKLVSQAISNYLKSTIKNEIKIIVGYDTRFLSEDFSKTSASVFAGNGIKCLYCKNPTPTPVISYEIISRKLSGGINITASHNPSEYNGLKFSPAWGGPALPETTKAIEQEIKLLKQSNIHETIKETDFESAVRQKMIEIIDPEKKYSNCLKQFINFNAIKNAKLKIGVDLMYGTARGYLDSILKNICKEIVVIHNYRDVLFGGKRPEPDKEGLGELQNIIKKQKLQLGLSCDGDADRFGILDSDGTYITPNQVISVLLYHLIKTRNWKGIVVRSVMTTHLIDAIADKFKIEVKETPVGFKYIGDIMVSSDTKDKFIIGGEESGGLSIRKHVPEKDGILACLLIAEMVSINKKTIKEILLEIEKLIGRKFITKRINYKLTPELVQTLKDKLKTNLPEKICDINVKNVNTIDGYKFILEDSSWVGIRFSGTEPVIRLYLETNSQTKLLQLKNYCETYFNIK